MHDEVSQYHSIGSVKILSLRDFTSYIVFRFLPPLIILILQISIFHKYFPYNQNALYNSGLLALTIIVSIIPRDGRILYSKEESNKRKAVHRVIIFVLLLEAVIIGMISKDYNFSLIAPNLGAVRDNLWSNMLSALIIIGFINLISIPKNRVPKDKFKIIEVKYSRIMRKYGTTIKKVCEEYQCHSGLLLSILIYEDMNRPRWFRFFEKVLFVQTKGEMTLGIAQVRTDKLINDNESIRIASELLQNTSAIDVANYDKVASVLFRYNFSKVFVDEVFDIVNYIKFLEITRNLNEH